MSRKTELQADLQRIGYQLGRAHETRQARSGTFNTFARVMRELNYGIRSAAQIGGKHLQAFVRHRLESGIAGRTVANEMSHLRAVLKQVGKQGLARNPAYSNRSLGIPQGSRIGTKQPLSDARIRAFQERMERLSRPNIGALLELQRALGLREMEAIRAGQADTLRRWHRELAQSGCVRVFDGTKNGRPREAHPADMGRARAAVQRAQEILEASGTRFLLTRAPMALKQRAWSKRRTFIKTSATAPAFRVMLPAMLSRKSVSRRIAMRATVRARRASRHPWILVMVMGEGATLRAFMSAAVRLNFGCRSDASERDQNMTFLGDVSLRRP